MENLCRLCANVTSPKQLACSIDNTILNIEQKLIDCCRWKQFDTFQNHNLPKKICVTCMYNLEKSWAFAESVAHAQQILCENIEEIKPTIFLEIESIDESIPNDDDHVEDLKVPLSPNDSFDNYDHESIECDDAENQNHQIQIEENREEHSEDEDKINVIRDNENDLLSALLSDDGKNPDGTISEEKISKLNLDDWSMIKPRCSICKDTHENYREFKAHFDKCHTLEDLKYLCTFCNKILGKRRSFCRHVITNHRPYLKHCCKRCNIFFWDLNVFKKHVNGSRCGYRQLERKTNFLCEICGKSFKEKAKLKSHTRLHLPIEQRRTFECYVCKATFAYKKSLVHHLSSHWGQKIQFQCDVCLSKFSRTDALRRHSLIHLGKLPHRCQYCDKGFRTKFNLKVHERIHTGERPYACTFCEYRSSDGPNLGKHIKQRHRDLIQG